MWVALCPRRVQLQFRRFAWGRRRHINHLRALTRERARTIAIPRGSSPQPATPAGGAPLAMGEICPLFVSDRVDRPVFVVESGGTGVASYDVDPTPEPSLFVSKLPLRVRFSLAVAAIAASVLGALYWLCLQMLAGEAEATFWFSLSGVLLVTLLVDQAARLLLYRPLAHMREAMQRAATGDLIARVSVRGGSLDEIGVIARGLNDILQGLERLNDAIDVRVEAATAVFRQQSAEIADSHREMAVLSEELARAGRLAALGQAAANMAHQIGTPLNLISGYVQVLIQSTPPESPAVDRLKAIQEQIAKVSAIVRTALDSSRSSSTPREHVEFAALVNGCAKWPAR
jgi:signal transduction histidine kinase